MQLGLGKSLHIRQSQQPFPTADLTCLLNMSTYEDEGTTYYRNSKGNDVPVVSGSGLDEILDFSVLNDTRFDKGSYVGNAYGLPEYYNYPYVGIYYDATSETTRQYWKLKDFAYAVILAQTIDTDIQNNYFLKAIATSDTSNEIASIQKLLIYDLPLTGDNLTIGKTYIGIQADFYGENIVLNSTFDNADYWSLYYGSEIKDSNLLLPNDGVAVQSTEIFNVTETFKIKIDVLSIFTGGVYFRGGSIYPVNDNELITESTGVTEKEIVVINSDVIRFGFISIGGESVINKIEIFKKYINYYKS